MSKFGYLKALEIDEARTAEYTIPGTSPALVLLVKHAGQGNEKYINAAVKWEAAHPQPVDNTSATLKWIGDKIREIFPQHVVTGWKGVVDGSGAPVTFTPAECADFLSQLPNRILVAMNVFATTAEHFHDVVVTPAQAEAVAKNS
jgi:hypothetical protein